MVAAATLVNVRKEKITFSCPGAVKAEVFFFKQNAQAIKTACIHINFCASKTVKVVLSSQGQWSGLIPSRLTSQFFAKFSSWRWHAL